MKKPLKFTIVEQITDLQEIPGNHPNQNPERGFLYLECDKVYFETHFNDLFEFESEGQYDHCFLAENCELSFADRTFCGVSFKGDLGKEAIGQMLKNRLNQLKINFGEIQNNTFVVGEEIIPLAQCQAIIYDYD